jgi:hypothetical protein
MVWFESWLLVDLAVSPVFARVAVKSDKRPPGTAPTASGGLGIVEDPFRVRSYLGPI